MTTYGEFSSLLQLGVGLGIGLSFFRAPVDLRIASISRRVDGEIVALRGAIHEFSKQKRRDLMDLKLRFTRARTAIEKKMQPFMVAAIVGAFLNLIGLVLATLDGQREASTFETLLLLVITTVYFIAIVGVLEVLARRDLGQIDRDLTEIQKRRAI